MNNIQIILLENPEDQGWKKIKDLFIRMYQSMESQGLMLPLANEGAEKWLRIARNTNGKFSQTFTALLDDNLIGFAHGTIKFLPDYLGGQAVGMITHIYVEDQYRHYGTGKKLIHQLEEWFIRKKVHSVELQVIIGNHAAMKFWRDLGFGEELRQYRKIF